MKHSTLATILTLGLAATGCVTEITASSMAYLGPHGSEVVVDRPAAAGALAITRLFTERGFGLVDQHAAAPGNQIILAFKGNRGAVTGGDKHGVYSSEIGSVFYVWVTPIDDTRSTVIMMGKPTIDGVEPCTDDGPTGPRLPCSKVLASYGQATQMSGYNEAEVVHGVFAELALEGHVVGAVPPSAPEVRNACRHDIFDQARAAKDDESRLEVLKALPTCG
jgi:hypothetical protein